MRAPILALRVGRRAVAGAVLTDEAMSFVDGRHLASAKGRAVPAALRYISRLLDLTRPGSVVVDAPHGPGSTTDQILTALVPMVRVPVAVISAADLLVAFGMPALATRVQLRAVTASLFPPDAFRSTGVRTSLVDASALALFAESSIALGILHD
jgi:hypothetical protein